MRVAILIAVAFFMTFFVYGIVAVLVRMDDFGLRLAKGATHPDDNRPGPADNIGRGIVRVMPKIFSAIGVVGTVAMLWVGGHILAANLAKVGFHPLHHAIEWAEELTHNPVLSWITGTAMSCLIGAVIGTLLALAWRPVHHALARRHKG